MTSERIQRRIDALLDEADEAIGQSDWLRVRDRANNVLALDPENADALSLLAAAGRASPGRSGAGPSLAEALTLPAQPLPTSFASGRYVVRSFLGEGGRKRVYLAHDTRLDRDVAIAVIKTEGLDAAGLARVRNEAQAMARLGDHPNVVTVFDVAEEAGQPLLVSQYMAGGSVEDLMAKAEDHRLPLGDTLRIAADVCQALDYAHQRGIVHRDLKPGNVWLTGEATSNRQQATRAERNPPSPPSTSPSPSTERGLGGEVSAKLGDFGLAVALDRSRVTMAGMMLGTVAYMPPEQALGGESTPKADLYSLGCMLYEMVTGRPPFLGEDPTAVISQHINTPPVAPSWLTDRCPPELEEVILHLLAKDPGQRSESAAAVREALLRVDPTQKSQSHSDSSENPLDRLARGVFVGRQTELDRLRKAFDEAFAGHGSLVLLVGEPGVGKTRTTQELETYARMRGAQVLWGRTHEAGGAPAYWPWYQAGNQFAAANDIAAVVAPQLPPGAGAELSRIFPWLRQQPNFVEPEPITDPEAAQFRLFDAYASYLRAMATHTPLVVALDDLHWADKPSLLLLQHVARDLSRLRILIVGNYRDTDITRQSALSESLAVLNRESGFERIVLRGLSKPEVANYIRATANVEPKREVLDRIFEETEGNAFFLTEVVNLMAQEGTLTKESVSDIRIPDGVREALGRRLNRLSEEANEFLQVAAIIGREFTYDMLTLLAERDEDALLKLIEEALEARVIEELPQAGRYRFTHAQMQETLLEELSTTRRVRLHGRVAEALEKRWGEEVARQRPSRLAHHFVEAAMLSARHAGKGVLYSKLAAEEAETRTAWDEAARHYENCLTLVTQAEDALGEDEAALLVALGRCARNGGEYRTAWRSLMRAITVCRQRADWAGAARATLESLLVEAPAQRQVANAREALKALGDNDPYLEARLLGEILRFPNLVSGLEREEARTRVSQLIETHGFEDVRAQVLMADAAEISLAGDFEEAARLRYAAYEIFARLGRAREGASALWLRGNSLEASGNLDAAQTASQEAFDYAHQQRIRYFEENAAARKASILLARCDLAAFDALAEERASDATWLIQIFRAARAEMAGDLDRAVALLPDLGSSGGVPAFLVDVHAERARVLWNAGREAEARQEFSRLREVLPASGARVFEGVAVAGPALVALDETLPVLADEAFLKAAERLYRVVEAEGHLPLFVTGLSVRRTFADLLLHLGHLEEAEEQYQAGLELTERERCPIQAGRCLVGLAEVAERRGQTREALQHLDRAIALFQQHGARLYLDRALAVKLRLQGIGATSVNSSIGYVNTQVQSEHPDLRAAAADDGSVTIMFSDIAGSTARAEALGDERWLELIRSHNAIVREQVQAHGGREVANRGDGFMVAFASPRTAVDCAIAIQRAFAQHTSAHAHEPIEVHIGLHTGRPAQDEGNFYGTDVNLAARIADHVARAGQVIVSERLRDALRRSRSLRFGEGEEVELKGLSGKHRVFEVLWTG